MKKTLFFVFLMMLLAACGGGTAVSPTAESEVPAAKPPTKEAAEAVATETVVEEVEEAENAADASFPAANVAGAAVVRERDWVKGAEEPIITIIEYGDFQ